MSVSLPKETVKQLAKLRLINILATGKKNCTLMWWRRNKMIGTCSRCKQKEQDIRRIDSYQLCKKCFGKANKIVKDKYKNIW